MEFIRHCQQGEADGKDPKWNHVAPGNVLFLAGVLQDEHEKQRGGAVDPDIKYF